MPHEVILAPVPLVHLESARQIDTGKLIVFSTDLPPFPDDWIGREIYFYGSKSEYKSPSDDLLKIPYHATFVRYVPAVSGKYNGTGTRPSSTGTDTCSTAFYEIADFKKLPKRLLISNFSKASGGKFAIGFAPHYPMIARLAD